MSIENSMESGSEMLVKLEKYVVPAVFIILKLSLGREKIFISYNMKLAECCFFFRS